MVQAFVIFNTEEHRILYLKLYSEIKEVSQKTFINYIVKEITEDLIFQKRRESEDSQMIKALAAIPNLIDPEFTIPRKFEKKNKDFEGVLSLKNKSIIGEKEFSVVYKEKSG